jgi:hypothetical protein
MGDEYVRNILDHVEAGAIAKSTVEEGDRIAQVG